MSPLSYTACLLYPSFVAFKNKTDRIWYVRNKNMIKMWCLLIFFFSQSENIVLMQRVDKNLNVCFKSSNVFFFLLLIGEELLFVILSFVMEELNEWEKSNFNDHIFFYKCSNEYLIAWGNVISLYNH